MLEISHTNPPENLVASAVGTEDGDISEGTVVMDDEVKEVGNPGVDKPAVDSSSELGSGAALGGETLAEAVNVLLTEVGAGAAVVSTEVRVVVTIRPPVTVGTA